MKTTIKHLIAFSTLIMASVVTLNAQTKTYDISGFDKITINPHIQVTFVKGDNSSVVIESSTEPLDKLNVEVNDETLELYLDDARVYTKSEKNNNIRKDVYNGTVIKATITYTSLSALSLRGEERFDFVSKIEAKDLKLSVYGDSQVYMKAVEVDNFKIATYGESYLMLESGTTNYQQIRAYGESKVNAINVDNKETKLTAYGEGSFQLNVSEKLKVTSYGEPVVTYKGNAKLSRGLSFGDATVRKL
jgi:hypothetical protein